MVNCKKKVVLNQKKGSFSGMEFSVGGLEWGDSRKGLHMSCELRFNDSLQNLGYKIKIRYWSIASEVIMRQEIFLKKRFDSGSFETRWKNSLRE